MEMTGPKGQSVRYEHGFVILTGIPHPQQQRVDACPYCGREATIFRVSSRHYSIWACGPCIQRHKLKRVRA